MQAGTLPPSVMQAGGSGSGISKAFAPTISTIKHIVKYDGILGLYKGLGVTMAREIPAIGTYFFCYKYIRSDIHQRQGGVAAPSLLWPHLLRVPWRERLLGLQCTPSMWSRRTCRPWPPRLQRPHSQPSRARPSWAWGQSCTELVVRGSSIEASAPLWSVRFQWMPPSSTSTRSSRPLGSCSSNAVRCNILLECLYMLCCKSIYEINKVF